MTKHELNAFRRTLESKLADLTDVSYSRQALTIEHSADELDRTQQAQARDFAVGALNRESARSREVRAALRRMDAGTFGICVVCEASINPKRLAAVPWASSCIICQNSAELAQTTLQGEMETYAAMDA